MADARSVVWIDSGGNSTITLIRTSSGAGTIEGDVLALSNADWFNQWEGTLFVNASPSPTFADYPSVTQNATLLFLCADGTNARLDIVAPKISIFMADGVTVDPSTITGLIADCVGNLLSASLSPAVSYLSGFLNRRS